MRKDSQAQVDPILNKKIDAVLKAVRASCMHEFDCGKIVTSELSVDYPSVTFTCKRCGGYIVLYPQDFINQIYYERIMK